MGYRSDVYIGVAFTSEAAMKEVLAVYTLDPRVQKHNLLKAWEIRDDNILYFEETSTKWHDGYDSVQGIKHMLDLAMSFHSERDMPMAFRMVRIGEDINDTEERYEAAGGGDGTLIARLFDGITLVRQVEVTL
jgi:hypothetical protein